MKAENLIKGESPQFGNPNHIDFVKEQKRHGCISCQDLAARYTNDVLKLFYSPRKPITCNCCGATYIPKN